MGQSLSVASIDRVRDSILLLLQRRFHGNGVKTSSSSSLSAQALAIFRDHHDHQDRGWVSSSDIDAILHELGLAGRWPRLAVDSFAHLFALPEDARETATTSSRLDYYLFLDVVFYPLVVAASTAAQQRKTLVITQQALVGLASCGLTVHSGEYAGESVTVKELALREASEETSNNNNDDEEDEDDEDPSSEEATAIRDHDGVERLRHRVNALRLVSHGNLVRYKATIQCQRSLYIIQAAHPSCTLHTILESFGAMKEPTVRRYVVQILDAAAFLHERDVVHGNLHLESVNIDSCGLLQLSEFGIGPELRATQKATARTSQVHHKNQWVEQFPPPEAIASQPRNTKAIDVWTVGMLILQMSYGVGKAAEVALAQTKKAASKPPGGTFSPQSTSLLSSTPPIPSTMSKSLRSVVQACLQRSARKRPAASQLLKMDFFQIHPAQATNEMLRGVCSDLDASMKRLTSSTAATGSGNGSGARLPTRSSGTTKQAPSMATRPTTAAKSSTTRPQVSIH